MPRLNDILITCRFRHLQTLWQHTALNRDSKRISWAPSHYIYLYNCLKIERRNLQRIKWHTFDLQGLLHGYLGLQRDQCSNYTYRFTMPFKNGTCINLLLSLIIEHDSTLGLGLYLICKHFGRLLMCSALWALKKPLARSSRRIFFSLKFASFDIATQPERGRGISMSIGISSIIVNLAKQFWSGLLLHKVANFRKTQEHTEF